MSDMALPESPQTESRATDIKKRKHKYDDTKGDTIFLRNVSRYDTDEDGLKAFMEENFGETTYCLICKDKETGESRGTAFVKFKDPESATKCLTEFKDMEMQYKFYLDGRNLFVLPALSKDEANEVKNAKAKPVEEQKKKVKKARHLPREKFFPTKKQAQDNSKQNAAKKPSKTKKGSPKNNVRKGPVNRKNMAKRKSNNPKSHSTRDIGKKFKKSKKPKRDGAL